MSECGWQVQYSASVLTSKLLEHVTKLLPLLCLIAREGRDVPRVMPEVVFVFFHDRRLGHRSMHSLCGVDIERLDGNMGHSLVKEGFERGIVVEDRIMGAILPSNNIASVVSAGGSGNSNKIHTYTRVGLYPRPRQSFQ